MTDIIEWSCFEDSTTIYWEQSQVQPPLHSNAWDWWEVSRDFTGEWDIHAKVAGIISDDVVLPLNWGFVNCGDVKECDWWMV